MGDLGVKGGGALSSMKLAEAVVVKKLEAEEVLFDDINSGNADDEAGDDSTMIAMVWTANLLEKLFRFLLALLIFR